LKEPSFHEIKKAIDETSAAIYEAFQQNKRTLLFVYYAGHGLMDNTTYCVVNGPRAYPLEKQLRCIAKQKGSYVVGVFDCCREKIPATAMRGSGAGPDDDDDSLEFLAEQNVSHENFIITYGCQPSSGVAIKSTMAQ